VRLPGECGAGGYSRGMVGRHRLGRLLGGSLTLGVLVLGLAACAPTPSASPTPTSTASATPTPTASPTPTPTASPTTPPTEEPTASPTPPPSSADVQIVQASYDPASSSISVVGQVANLVSATGVCRITVAQDATVLQASAAGMPDAAVTYCAGLSVVVPAGSGGSWTVVLEFADDTVSGSATTQVTT
jgi:hypothetical protein